MAGRIPGRSIRVEDELWQQALEAARWRGDKVSTVIRRSLTAYVRTTHKLMREHEERAHDSDDSTTPGGQPRGNWRGR